VNTRYETEHDLREAGQDREISLGTTTILGIFFALALLCAVFFGFGYSLGKRSAPPMPVPSSAATGADTGLAKPSPDSPVDQTTSTAPALKPAADIQSAVVPVDSPNDAAQAADPAPKKIAVNLRSAARSEPPTSPKPAALVPVASVTPVSGSSVVQVAAMSHQEDADVVAADLKRRGYTVTVRRVPQDKFFHVQIGPFASKKDTDAMRQRLQADGYNSAIVK
jgi:DedD protein